MTETEIWKSMTPNPGQVAFLNAPERLRALLGGRGSGKTAIGAIEAIRQVQEQPGLPGAIVAPNFPTLTKSTLPEFLSWVPDGHIKQHNKSEQWFLFRNGSKVYYSGIDDEDSWRGPNLAWCWFDESGIKKTSAAWLVVLGCVRIGDAKLWTTTTPRGKAHWLYDTFCKNPEPGIHWHGFASSRENAHNLDPQFIKTLESSYVGPWKLQELEGKFISGFGTLAQREWFEIVAEAPETRQRARFWDLAATEKKTAKADPDYTAGARVCKEGKDSYIEHIVRGQLSPDDVEKLLIQTAKADGLIRIGIEQEPGASGKTLIRHYEKLLRGYWMQGFRPTGDKVARAMPWIARAKAGHVKLVAGAWNEAFLDEVENFPVSGVHDDQVDAISGAMDMLDSTRAPQIFVIG